MNLNENQKLVIRIALIIILSFGVGYISGIYRMVNVFPKKEYKIFYISNPHFEFNISKSK